MSVQTDLGDHLNRCAASDPEAFRDALKPIFAKWIREAGLEAALANIYGFLRFGQADDARSALHVFHGWYRGVMADGGHPSCATLGEALMYRAALRSSEAREDHNSSLTARLNRVN